MRNRFAVLQTVMLSVGLAAALNAGAAFADDWPGWMGPGRDNVWKETGLIDAFPQGGPKVVWRTPIAGGYAGPAVAGGKVFVTDYVTSDDVKIGNFERREFTGTERVLCLSEQSGEILWKHEYPVKYTVSYPSGPRCTPNVDGDRVYTLGSEGHLFCFNVADGKIVWSRELKKDYGTKAALWGYAAHPLIDGDHLITLAGGEGSHIVALNKLTGAEVWKSTTSREQGYSPPTIIEQAGVRQLILCRPDGVSAISPDDGSEYWSVPYEATSGSIIMSPIKIGDYLYVAGYSNKSLLLKLDPEKPAATEVWRDKRNVISPVNVQPFAVDNIIYGLDQKGVMRALEIPSGERLWETAEVIETRPRGSGTAFIVQQADRFWLFNELGELIIAKLSKDGYQEIDRAQVIEKSNLAFGREVVWSMPAFANRHAYIRNDDEIIRLDLSAP